MLSYFPKLPLKSPWPAVIYSLKIEMSVAPPIMRPHVNPPARTDGATEQQKQKRLLCIKTFQEQQFRRPYQDVQLMLQKPDVYPHPDGESPPTTPHTEGSKRHFLHNFLVWKKKILRWSNHKARQEDPDLGECGCYYI